MQAQLSGPDSLLNVHESSVRLHHTNPRLPRRAVATAYCSPGQRRGGRFCFIMWQDVGGMGDAAGGKGIDEYEKRQKKEVCSRAQ